MAMSTKVPAAIVGPGNIGTDLMMKLLRSEVIEPRYMVGVDPRRRGCAWPSRAGLEASADGVDWLLADPSCPPSSSRPPSAYVHVRNAPRYQAAGHPGRRPHAGRRGPYVVPPVNLADHLGVPTSTWSPAAARRRSRSCTRSAASPPSTTPRSWRRWRRRRPVPAPGPNIDEFTRTTAPGVEVLGGATRGKAIIILNPAEPPLIIRDTIYCSLPADADHDKVAASIHDMVADVQTYVPGYRLRGEPAVRRDGRRQRSGGHLRRGRGRRRLPAALLRQPRHHDGRGDEGGRGARPRAPATGARRTEGPTSPNSAGDIRAMTFSDFLDLRVTGVRRTEGPTSPNSTGATRHRRSRTR